VRVALCCMILACFVALLGCETIPVRSSDDSSAGKLQWASELFSSKDEPVHAEELIREEIERYKKEKNQLGLAAAYRQYGLFFRSTAVIKFAKYYHEKGFEDKTVKFEQRYEKAIEYFNKSREIYENYGHVDISSSLYISLAKTYDLMNRQQEACDAFSAGLESYIAYKKLNPEALEFRSEEMQNYEEYIGSMKQQAGCKDKAPGSVVPTRAPDKEIPQPQPSPDMNDVKPENPDQVKIDQVREEVKPSTTPETPAVQKTE